MHELLSGRRVLVVEDEMLVLMETEDMLMALGCDEITVAATVAQALAFVATQPFDLAIVDMNLNGIRTDAVCDALAARGVLFVFATGYASQDTGGPHEDRPLLRKPVRLQDMSDVITRLLAHA